MSHLSTGTVKWFSDSKGFGFIQQDHGPDVFTHFKEIRSSGFTTLNEGQRVSFEIGNGQQGPKAINIKEI